MRVGIIGDLHLPFEHPMYLRFIQDVFRKWRVDEPLFIGDMFDMHNYSFWDHDPNGLSAEDEARSAMQKAARWHKVFPGKRAARGNHDERAFRLAKKHGLPDRFLRPPNEVWGTSWKWAFEHVLDGVLYTHGTGTSGKDAAINNAIQRRMSVVQGHVHSYAGVKYHCNPTSRIFGMNVGCGIDVRAYAFEYGRAFAVRPVLGCGIVADGEFAVFVPMACGKGEPYHRSRAGKKELRKAA